MTLELVTAPATDPITDLSLWEHLKLDISGSPAVPDDQDYVDALKAAAISYLDGAEGILGRALITQTWKLHLNSFPYVSWDETGYSRSRAGSEIRIPLPPLQSVSSITYVDTDGATQTLASSVYRVINRQKWPSGIIEAYGQSWPSTRSQPQAVTVEFVAGYGDADTDVPDAIKHAIKLAVSGWYENRLPVSVGKTVSEFPMAFDALIAPYKLPTFG